MRVAIRSMTFISTIINQMIRFKTAEFRLNKTALSLPARTDLHLARKIWHATMGCIVVGIYASGHLSDTAALILLGMFFCFDIFMETLRLKDPTFNEKCLKIFGSIIRKSEVSKMSSVPHFVAAAIVAVALFPKPVVVLCLLFLALGDPAASFFGVLFKNRSIKIFGDKSLHGSLACFLVCAAVSYFYLKSGGLGGLVLTRLTLLGGFAGALAEALPLEIDDNFTVPVVSGLIMWAGFLLVNFV